ncbi:Molybdenum transport system permease protein ModB [bacterium HR29]|jgi:molybdate transport system permease protein|nr:Molybdenum transport system permease protein ModB [bacterium HR29]
MNHALLVVGIEPADVRLSLQVAGGATLLAAVAGLPLAWWLARARFKGKAALEAVVMAPMVLPPTVVGFYLLRLLGQGSSFGRFLDEAIGVRLVFTWQGAAIAAAVLSLPLLVRTAEAAFAEVDPEYERVAASLGKPPWLVFLTVTLPLAARGVAAGLALAFARAMGEFGATVMVAGNIPGKTRTLPMSVYDAVQAGDLARAHASAALLAAVSLASVAAVSWLVGTVRR